MRLTGRAMELEYPAARGRVVKIRSLAANTVIMSLRTVATMAISLYSSRVILAELGTVDYGIYFAVAGVTLLISFLNSSLATSTQRFLSVEIARPDHGRLRAVFSASMQIHVAMALLVLLASETLGLWLLETHMVIPEARMDAARVVFHFAVSSTVLTIVQVPYTATLAAFERFTAYAVFDILHAVLRLLVAVMLTVGSGDLLELFSALMFGVTLTVAIAKAAYCMRAIPASRYRPSRDGALLYDMTGFAGWTVLGAASLAFNIQGVGILLNLFFGPVANAAQTIGLQLTNATSTLASNLQITSNPQIVKAYAADDRDRFHALVEQSSRLSFLLMLTLTAPIIVGVEAILDIWLQTVPYQAGEMARLLLLAALVNSFSFPLMAAAQATGTIRLYQILVSGVMLSALPLGFLMFSLGVGPLSIFQLLLVLSILALGVRLLLLRHLIGLDLGRFMGVVLLPGIAVGALALSAGWGMRLLSPAEVPADMAGLLATGLATPVAAFLLGISGAERRQLRETILKRRNMERKCP
ncbi:MAG: hypothetical protein M9939_08475 [Mesorhizobium sp.]|nr:hypothetical protein [Mesorhizobium sp.]MCO5161156.1 hypothetical protein [Mesorhizobium sp.]